MGATINEIQEASNTDIKMNQDTKEAGYSYAIVTSIKNVEADLDTAERLINEKIAGGGGGGGGGGGMQQGNQPLPTPAGNETKELRVDKVHVGGLIGKGGEVIRGMTSEAGCQIQIDQTSPGEQATVIIGPGSVEQVQRAEDLINAKIMEKSWGKGGCGGMGGMRPMGGYGPRPGGLGAVPPPMGCGMEGGLGMPRPPGMGGMPGNVPRPPLPLNLPPGKGGPMNNSFGGGCGGCGCGGGCGGCGCGGCGGCGCGGCGGCGCGGKGAWNGGGSYGGCGGPGCGGCGCGGGLGGGPGLGGGGLGGGGLGGGGMGGGGLGGGGLGGGGLGGGGLGGGGLGGGGLGGAPMGGGPMGGGLGGGCGGGCYGKGGPPQWGGQQGW